MALNLKSCLKRGQLRHLIEFCDPCFIDDDDDMGGSDSEEVCIHSTFGMIRPCTAQEIFENRQRKMEVSHRIDVRFMKNFDVLARYTIEAKNRRFRIEGLINVEERDIWLVIFAKELEGSNTAIASDQLYNTNNAPLFNTDNKPVFNTDAT